MLNEHMRQSGFRQSDAHQRVFALDIARFLAALLVVLYHYLGRIDSDAFTNTYVFAKFGWMGVPFFFILSGYVIAQSAVGKTGVRFAVDRFVRLFPTLWVCILLTCLVWYLSSYPDKTIDFYIFISSFTLLNSIFDLPYADGVYWTLFEELKFYFLIWLLVSLKLFSRVKIWLSVWLALVFFHNFAAEIPHLSKFVNPNYAAFFIAGVAFSYYNKPTYKIWAIVILCLTLTVSIKTIDKVLNNYINMPVASDFFVCLGLLFLCYLFFICILYGRPNKFGSATKNKNVRCPYHKIFVLLGGISYPLYLLHNIAGKSLIYAWSPYFHPNVVVVVVIFLSLFVAGLVHIMLERKLLPILKSVMLRVINLSK